MNADIYVLANDRKKETVIHILDSFLPERYSQTNRNKAVFEFWNESENATGQQSSFFNTEMELFDFLENQSGILFRPSFRPKSNSEFHALQLYYFEDNSLVVGVNILQSKSKEDRALEKLKRLLNSEYGYISYHMPPAYGRKAFIKQCISLDSNKKH